MPLARCLQAETLTSILARRHVRRTLPDACRSAYLASAKICASLQDRRTMKISVGLYGTNAHQIALAMIQGFNKHYRCSARPARRPRLASSRATGWACTRRSRNASVSTMTASTNASSACATSSTPSNIDHADLAAGQAALHRAAAQPQAAGTGRDLLQLGDDQDPAPQLFPQRFHFRPPDAFRPRTSKPTTTPTYRSYYAKDDGLRGAIRKIVKDFELAAAVRRPRARRRPRLPRGSPLPEGHAGARGQFPDPGAGLGLLPQQGRLHHRQGDQRRHRIPVRDPRPARRRRQALPRHHPARRLADRPALLAVARLFHGRHGSAVRLRPVPARHPAQQAALRALHHARPRQAGQDHVLPRLHLSPAPFGGQVHHGPRHPRPGHAGVHAAFLPLRLQDHQGRLRQLQGDGPRHRQAQIHDGQAG